MRWVCPELCVNARMAFVRASLGVLANRKLLRPMTKGFLLRSAKLLETSEPAVQQIVAQPGPLPQRVMRPLGQTRSWVTGADLLLLEELRQQRY